ncbi:MAG: hypothetical protein BroJett011_49560 [Chloroflexota bacterium]|nr:MAG: hypothetical protein BroJett011_49560 [Chloroflexota bacterium]
MQDQMDAYDQQHHQASPAVEIYPIGPGEAEESKMVERITPTSITSTGQYQPDNQTGQAGHYESGKQQAVQAKIQASLVRCLAPETLSYTCQPPPMESQMGNHPR